MSQDVLMILKKMNMEDLQVQIALQCAPLLAGVKISNLLIVRREQAKAVEAVFAETDLCCVCINETLLKTTFLLYRENELLAYMRQEDNLRLMQEFGYEEMELDQVLPRLSARYKNYMTVGGTFPHEMGICLGYPAADVKGFIQEKGENYLYSGYWKVYDDLNNTLVLFKKFQEAKENAIRLLSYGMNISEIWGYYRAIACSS